ncbi:MAG: hypothetical protein WCH34_05935 [Bacteroidota bacterium]
MENEVKLKGFLFSKLANIGSKSEGPAYFLQLQNYEEIKIEKKATLWEIDKTLQPFLGKKVEIEGYFVEHILNYNQVKEIQN